MQRTTLFKAGLVLVITAGLVLAWGATPLAAEESLQDSRVADAVDDRLMGDPAVPGDFIDVAATRGIVTLTGEVDNLCAKKRAAKLAGTVKGVRGVVNRVEVEPAFRSDTLIEEDVEQALLTDAVTESWEIEPAVEDSVVTLTGTVESWQEKQLAAKVAAGVKGVKGIRNEITVDYETDRADAEIQEEIDRALRWDAYVDDSLIEVSVEEGKVTLDGVVGSLAEKQRAYDKAWVAGVAGVDRSGLEIRWWARNEKLRKEKYVSRTDQEIRKAVQDAFLYDPRVLSFEIEVQPDDGLVTLRGTVDNLKAKRAAAQDARSVVGVWQVDNQIKVRPNTPSDDRIETNVEQALLRDPYVDRYEIDVEVVNGIVYLYGDVDSVFEKSQADDIAAMQNGVRGVNNSLTVNGVAAVFFNPYTDDWYLYDYDWFMAADSPTTMTDWEIKEEIEDEFFWSPYVDGDEIQVTVEDGVATLTGTVDTWGERMDATENALEGGAVAVDNDLVVHYGPDYYME